MHNSTIPIDVQILTPESFLDLVKQKRIVLQEPSSQLLRSTIQKIIASQEPINTIYHQIGHCKN